MTALPDFYREERLAMRRYRLRRGWRIVVMGGLGMGLVLLACWRLDHPLEK